MVDMPHPRRTDVHQHLVGGRHVVGLKLVGPGPALALLLEGRSQVVGGGLWILHPKARCTCPPPLQLLLRC